MMKSTPRSQLLLLELICDLVIFAICAVVCVALLVQARVMSLESTHLTQAVYIAQTAAETYLSGNPLPEGYNAHGVPAQAADVVYQAVVTPLSDGDARISVHTTSGIQDVYTLTIRGGIRP